MADLKTRKRERDQATTQVAAQPSCPPVSEGDLVREARALDRSSRGGDLFRYTYSSTARKERSCRLCERTVSWCARYPRTKGSLEVEAEHVMEHRRECWVDHGGDVRAYVAEFFKAEAERQEARECAERKGSDG